MSLDAVVYKSKKNLNFNPELEHALVDNETGEVYFEEPASRAKYPLHALTAIHKRLGNLDNIARLRQEIRQAVGHDNTLLHTRWLYNAFHSGDVIGLEDLDSMEKELEFVKKATEGTRSRSLESFLQDVSELIVAARSQANPIVFI
jgi:hypothetical protein